MEPLFDSIRRAIQKRDGAFDSIHRAIQKRDGALV